jgi:hypothetical protein
MDSNSKLTIQINTVGDFSAFTQGAVSMEKLETAITAAKSALGGLAGVLGVGLSAVGLFNLGKSAEELGKNIQEMSVGMGISTDAIQILG